MSQQRERRFAGHAGFLLRDGDPMQREPVTLGEELALGGEPGVLMLSARESVTFQLSSR